MTLQSFWYLSLAKVQQSAINHSTNEGISTMVNGTLLNFGKKYEDNLRVIFDQWPKLHLRLDALSNQKIFKGIYLIYNIEVHILDTLFTLSGTVVLEQYRCVSCWRYIGWWFISPTAGGFPPNWHCRSGHHCTSLGYDIRWERATSPTTHDNKNSSWTLLICWKPKIEIGEIVCLEILCNLSIPKNTYFVVRSYVNRIEAVGSSKVCKWM